MTLLLKRVFGFKKIDINSLNKLFLNDDRADFVFSKTYKFCILANDIFVEKILALAFWKKIFYETSFAISPGSFFSVKIFFLRIRFECLYLHPILVEIRALMA